MLVPLAAVAIVAAVMLAVVLSRAECRHGAYSFRHPVTLADRPVGHIRELRRTPDGGIEVEGELTDTRLVEMLRRDLTGGISIGGSIGYIPTNDELPESLDPDATDRLLAEILAHLAEPLE